MRAALALTWAAIVLVGIIAVAGMMPPAVSYGGGVNPTPDPLEVARDAERVPVLPSGFVGVRVTNSVNQVADGPLTFDTVRWGSDGWWSSDKPTRVTFPVSGICEIRAQITVLGTWYDGNPATDIGLFVIRDGDPHAFVAYGRLSDERPEPAHGMEASTTDWFEEGEYLEVLVTPGLTVESNWPGRANVSPVLTVVC